jgi:hypothetical protein
MGLDVYVGSLTRYYAGDWELIAQQAARETGVPLQVVRAQADPADAIRDPDAIRPVVKQWRDQLSESLSEHLSAPLDWNEEADAPYFTDKPAWDCYSDLLLWAAYSEHPELARPENSIEDFGHDPAYARSTAKDFRSRYFHLLEVEWWLPCDFSFVFQAEKVGGGAVLIGSSVILARQFEDLNSRTWRAPSDLLGAWRREGSEHGAPLESGARFAFAVLRDLAEKSVTNRLPMLLDY